MRRDVLMIQQKQDQKKPAANKAELEEIKSVRIAILKKKLF